MKSLGMLNSKPELFHTDTDENPIWYLLDSYISRANDMIAYFGQLLPAANWVTSLASQYIPNYFTPYFYLTVTNGTYYAPTSTLNARAIETLPNMKSIPLEWPSSRFDAWLKDQGTLNFRNMRYVMEQEAAWAEVEFFKVY